MKPFPFFFQLIAHIMTLSITSDLCICLFNKLLRPLSLQVSERVLLLMPLQQPVWCTQWPMRAPWANWRLAAAMRSGAGMRKPSESNSTVCNWRPFTAGRVWYMASWSTSLLTSRDHRTPGNGVAAALMWNLEKSSPGTSLMPVKPTGTSTPGWGCITIEWGGRWAGRNTNISPQLFF